MRKTITVTSGEQLKLEALESVAENADPRFMEMARSAVIVLASKRHVFTTDDVWQMLGLRTCREPRAMGAIMRQAAQDHIIERTGDYVRSERAVNHARPVAVWRGC